MSLNIDCTRCTNQTAEAKATRETWLQIVAYLCMFTGCTNITAKNFEEVARRFEEWESLGALAGDIHGPVTRDTLRAFIGAGTNVSSMTRRQFTTRFNQYAGSKARSNAARKAV